MQVSRIRNEKTGELRDYRPHPDPENTLATEGTPPPLSNENVFSLM